MIMFRRSHTPPHYALHSALDTRMLETRAMSSNQQVGDPLPYMIR